MGKKQHSKDRMYITATEWKRDFGGHKEDKASKQHRRLPFDRCSLSFTPFETPVCSPDGYVFDILNIIPYIKKHKINPVTGKTLKAKELTRLKFHKNSDGKYMCPVTFKVFTHFSHIVAIKTSGHVYSMEAVQQFNVKMKSWEDLISSEPFTKSDIITLQDPNKVTGKDVTSFFHVQGKEAKQRVIAGKTESGTMDKIVTPDEAKGTGVKSIYTKSAYTSSFTSTAVTPMPRTEKADMSELEVRQMRYGQLLRTSRKGKRGTKAYVRLVTNVGSINLELHTDLVPRTCHNFLLLCKRKYYDKTIFHRVIPGFMVQGGDPTGTGRGGKSAWGEKCKDEWHDLLKHDVRGVLSMANSGPHTNGSQFFLTFGEAAHLDRKHSVFGRLVGGMETLDKIERVQTSNVSGSKDKPITDIVIKETVVFSSPFDEEFVPDHEIARRKEKEEEDRAEKERKEERRSWYSAPQVEGVKPVGEGIGRFIEAKQQEAANQRKRKRQMLPNRSVISAAPVPAAPSSSSHLYSQGAEAPKKAKKVNQFNFSNW